MIDICTVVFRDELGVLPAQAQSIAKYCGSLGIRNIYVVLNDDDTVVEQIDPRWWGDLAPLVLIVPRTMFSTAWVDNGWVSQQLWKLLMSSVSYNTWTMVLDAKTIFVQEQTITKLIDEQGRACMGTMPLYPVFEPARQIVNQVYNIDLQQQIGPGGVPFLFHNDSVRLMIAQTTIAVRESFPQWFQRQGVLTEFVLYSGFVQARYGSHSVLYNDNASLQPCNVCHSEVHQFEQKFLQMHHSDTVSVHRKAWAELTQDQRSRYRNFLIDRNISQAWNLN